MIQALGARYSPHDNPVERIWAALKAWLANSPTLTIQGRLRQVHAFFRQRSPAQLLATAAPDSSPWLPDRYRHCPREAAQQLHGQLCEGDRLNPSRGGTMEQVEVDGLRIAYQRTGAGPPLVLLHGYVGDGPTTWRHQLDGLCDQFTVVAWDAPGAGGSADPPESFGLAGYADCLAGFVQRLGLEQPQVAGLSFGGILALELSRRHATIPATLILASAYAGWAGSLPADVAQQRLQQALGLAELSPEEFVGALLPTMFSQATPPEAVEAFGASMLGFHPAGFRAMARASAENVRDVLPHIKVPTLLVYGDKDVRAPLAVAEDLHAAIPGSTLVVLSDAGHICNIEAPEAFNRTVRSFLRDRRS